MPIPQKMIAALALPNTRATSRMTSGSMPQIFDAISGGYFWTPSATRAKSSVCLPMYASSVSPSEMITCMMAL